MWRSDLARLLGSRIIGPDAPGADRYEHDMVKDKTWHQTPAAIVFPETTEEVAEIVKIARRDRVPVTARGAGSGLAGGAIAVADGIVCSLEKMNRVLEIDTANFTATVEPGVITKELDAMLEPHGLFFAGYPMSEEICSIGGNVATNAGGGRAIKYGVTGAHVLGLRVVTGTGSVLRIGGKRLKDVTGLNLLPLFVGSEGVLGIITEITLRLTPRPAARRVILAAFNDPVSATNCIRLLRTEARRVPSSVEYIDANSARGAVANAKSSFLQTVEAYPADGALLLIEAEGDDRTEAEQVVERYSTVIRTSGGHILSAGESRKDHDAIWKLRKAVPWWIKRVAGEYQSSEDVVVPPAAVADLVAGARAISDGSPLDVAIFGHAADGNFHINPMKPQEMSVDRWRTELDQFLDELYALTIELGGTISGEHGIGRKRSRYLIRATGSDEVAAMRAIKAALDPDSILNPGVIIPDE